MVFFFFSSRRRHTRLVSDWSSDVCSSDLARDVVSEVRRREDDRGPAEHEIVGAGERRHRCRVDGVPSNDEVEAAGLLKTCIARVERRRAERVVERAQGIGAAHRVEVHGEGARTGGAGAERVVAGDDRRLGWCSERERRGCGECEGKFTHDTSPAVNSLLILFLWPINGERLPTFAGQTRVTEGPSWE